MSIKKVQKRLNKILGDFKQEDCKIPFVAVATELDTGEQSNLQKGNLTQNILASIAIPGIFPQVKINNKTYCDGGLLDNLPEDVARELMPDAVIVSVDVIGEYKRQVERHKLKTLETFINAFMLMLQDSVQNKPMLADLRINLTQKNVSMLYFNDKVAGKSIHNGALYAKKYIGQIKKLLEGVGDENNAGNNNECETKEG